MSNLFPNEETNFLSFGQLTIQPASYDSMLPGVTALAQSHTLRCKLLIHPNCDIKTLFSMLILASRHVITKMFIRVFEEVSISDLIKVAFFFIN